MDMKSLGSDGLLEGDPGGNGAWCCAAVRGKVRSML